MTTKIQLRGNCQRCGREQAVLAPSGTMAKHGSTDKGGWFIGGCSGHNYGPMQEDISVTRDIVATVRADVAKLLEIYALFVFRTDCYVELVVFSFNYKRCFLAHDALPDVELTFTPITGSFAVSLVFDFWQIEGSEDINS